MKQTKIETGYSAQLHYSAQLCAASNFEVSVDRNPFPKTAKALASLLGRPEGVIK